MCCVIDSVCELFGETIRNIFVESVMEVLSALADPEGGQGALAPPPQIEK